MTRLLCSDVFQGHRCGVGARLDSSSFAVRPQIMRAVNSSKFVVPEGYWEQYKMARVTFRHHIIYNPATEVGRSPAGAFVHTVLNSPKCVNGGVQRALLSLEPRECLSLL